MDPISKFKDLFEQIKKKGLPKAEAGFLATSSRKGIPSGRVVLLKGIEGEKLLFFTNYLSHKGRDLTENPLASLVFWWDLLGVQIRFEGKITRSSTQISDEYWDSRPFDSNISGSVSQQSQPIPSYKDLVSKAEAFKSQIKSQKVPRPENWGGYFLDPDRIEFWFDKPNRLHLRESFTRQGDNWVVQVLQP